MIPLGTDRPKRRRSVVTPAIIGVTVLMHIILSAIEISDEESYLRVISSLWIVGGPDFKWWGLVTCVLVHGSLMHLGGNMLFLWVFGSAIEDRLGRMGFLALYLCGAIASAAFHAVTSFETVRFAGESVRVYIPAIGASGAVCAVAGMFLVLMPRSQVRVVMLILVIGVISVPAWWFIGFHIVIDVVMGGLGDSGVARGAHLAGYAFGGAAALVLLKTRVLTPEIYDLFSMVKQAKRRREFEAAGEIHEQRVARARKKLERMSEAQQERELAKQDARAGVIRAVRGGNAAVTAVAYRGLLADHGGSGVIFARDDQLTLGNQLLGAGEHQLAAKAYDGFLANYGEDAEAPATRVLLALVNTRYLNDPIRAKALLLEAKGQTLSSEQSALADALLVEIG